MKDDHFVHAFPTLFLPIEVPLRPLSEEAEGKDEDQSILLCWQDFVKSANFSSSFEAPSTVVTRTAERFVSLHWEGNQGNAEAIRQSLKNLPQSEYWGLYFKEQNAALLVYTESETSMIVMAWEVQCPNRSVTGEIAPVLQNLPRWATRVPSKRFLDSFELLSDLVTNKQDKALAKTHKAEQDFEETRDVANPMYVLDVLFCALGGEALEQDDTVCVVKKMRDEVRYRSSALPWRRAPLWAVFKGILHLVCKKTTGGSDILYKSLIQSFLAFSLERVASMIDNGVVTPSGLTEASRKLVRRLAKLQEKGTDTQLLRCTKEATDRAARKVMGIVRSWEVNNKKQERPPCTWDMPMNAITPDITHQMPSAGEKLCYLLSIANERNGDISPVTNNDDHDKEVPPPKIIGRKCQWSALSPNDVEIQTDLLEKSLEKYATSPQDFICVLHDIYEGTMKAFSDMEIQTIRFDSSTDALAKNLTKLHVAVIKTGLGSTKYRQDPFKDDVLGRSKVILTALTICLIIDQVACRANPLLLEHRLGTEKSLLLQLERLFLSSCQQKDHLHRIESYLKRRDEASGPPILEGSVSSKSFGVQFAKRDSSMLAAKNEILEICQQNQERKRKEQRQKLDRHASLTNYVSSNVCTCTWEQYGYNNRYHYVTCLRCSRKNEAEGIVLNYYEKLLPSKAFQQLAVVYDLKRPVTLVCQSESLIDFAELVCGESWSDGAEWKGFWQDEIELQAWHDTISSKMRLGSTRKKITQSHYSRAVHVTSQHDFVVECDYRTTPMGPSGPLNCVTSWKWEIGSHTTVKLPEGCYSSLETFYNSWSHSENDVIALKSNANHMLSLAEFETVGTLRAGHNLQLIRLITEGLAQGNLSLEREEIVSLVSCVLWQAGPSQVHWFRDAFLVFQRTQNFAFDSCHILNVVKDGSRHNWSNQNTLLNVILIARSFYEHAALEEQTDGVAACAELLRSCRNVSVEWLDALATASNGCTDDSQMQTLRNRMADIAAAGTLSFMDTDALLMDSTDIAVWCFFRATFQDNLSPSHILTPSWRRMYWFLATEVAVILLPRLNNIIQNTAKMGEDGFCLFLSMYWSSSKNGMIDQLWSSANKEDPSSGWYRATFRHSNLQLCVLQYDLVGGSFLVDGAPCACLPKAILASKVYQRLFGEARFVVQPTGHGGQRTAKPVRGFFYEFYPACFNEALTKGRTPLIVQEKDSGDKDRCLLVPDSILIGDFPHILVDKYSHWFMLTGPRYGTLRFRSMTYESEKMQDPFANDAYDFDCRNFCLQERRSSSYLLDINSGSFKQLYKRVFYRLTPLAYMHILVGSSIGADSVITINLPRLENIRFDYDGKHLASREFCNLRVSEEQNMGTLMGLNHGLLLEDPAKNARSLFLCPNGEVNHCGSSVEIDTENIKSPSLFKYKLRKEFGDLHGTSKVCIEWLFLALLHAHTSNIHADAFTGCTGSERAVWLLRSGHCCGNLTSSIDKEQLRAQLVPEIELLGKIAAISPERSEYHSTGMENVRFQIQLVLIGNAGFSFLAKLKIDAISNALIRISDSYDACISSEVKDISTNVLAKRTNLLSRRSYFRHKIFHQDQLLLTDQEDRSLFGFSDLKYSAYISPIGFKNLHMPRKIGFISHNRVPVDNSASLQNLLCQKVNLVGVSHPQIVLTGYSGECYQTLKNKNRKITLIAHSLDFSDMWLNLYRMAKFDIRGISNKTRFGNLITWIAAEMPEQMPYLSQLSTIAANSGCFPSPPTHLHYSYPGEYAFSLNNIEDLLNKYKVRFDEEEPFLPQGATEYQRRLIKDWTERKARYECKWQVLKKTVLSLIKSRFHEGHIIASNEVNSPMLSAHSELVAEICALFQRWRNARELGQFLAMVNKVLLSIQISSHDMAQTIVRFEVRNSVTVKTYFLNTGKDFYTTASQVIAHGSRKGASERKARLPSTFLLNDTRVAQAKSTANESRTGSRIRKLSFSGGLSKKNPEYSILYKLMTEQLKESWDLALRENESVGDLQVSTRSLYMGLVGYFADAQKKMELIWKDIKSVLLGSNELQEVVGLWNIPTPWKILSHHFSSYINEGFYKPSTLQDYKDEEDSDGSVASGNTVYGTGGYMVKEIWSDLVLDFAICVRHVQRAQRCLSMLQKENIGANKIHPLLRNDLTNPGCQNWSPKEYPEFLAFELDNDICIRPIQATVAIEMLRSDGNRLLQLNMGQGKSAVIMPLVLCVAARGNAIVRATVLSSLYATNATDWQWKLGGLLGRRICSLPFQRDLALRSKQVGSIKQFLETIKSNGDILVTVPEHRLSLENKSLELCSSKTIQSNLTVGRALIEIIDTLASNGREFLDESDEILSPKYQLMYTLGAPVDLDGGNVRKNLHAAISQSIQGHAKILQKKFGFDTVEVLTSTTAGVERPCSLRLLESPKMDALYKELCVLIVSDIRSGAVPMEAPLSLKLRPQEVEIWKKCIDGKEVTEKELDTLTGIQRTSALCLRGLLSFGVLKNVLQKRFRVDFGVHPTKKERRMAVPYRAKDVAADRTEFGHPDMALAFTFISYYSSGLSERQVKDVFARLEQMGKTKAKAMYQMWVKDVHLENNNGLAEYEGVNLQDPVLFNEKIFPLFRANAMVIDFWLIKIVLPVEAKQFPHTLVSNAGDLCRSVDLGVGQWKAVTTGFSGTDDLSYLLPLTIVQENLEELRKTNGVQLLSIIQKENNFYYPLKDSEQSENRENLTEQLLILLTNEERRSNVVLDSGALVMQMGNLEFAVSWLERRPDMEACVFFIGDRLFHVTNNDGNRPISFNGSPFAENMTKCLLYLDEEHTRGSDFRLPLTTRAIVTLGKGMTKDKLVQTCMRMRQLGHCQTISFISAPDVHSLLEKEYFFRFKSKIPDTFIPSAIMDWTVSNTVKKTCDLFPYFVGQAVCTLKKAEAFKAHHSQPKSSSPESVRLLADACIGNDTILLRDMYGGVLTEATLRDITELRTQGISSNHDIVEKIRQRVDIAGDVPGSCSLLDEEQERELENELEEERQVERPPPETALKPHISPELKKLLKLRVIPPRKNTVVQLMKSFGFGSLFDYLKETSLGQKAVANQLAEVPIFCTMDFRRCVQGENNLKDAYLKRCRWVLHCCDNVVCLISNFEAEEYAASVGSNEKNHQRIWLFSPILKLSQPSVILRTISSESIQGALHVFGGSINAKSELLEKIRIFLGLFPCPSQDDKRSSWYRLFEQAEIERDGFVPADCRQTVDACLSSSPFHQSPVELVMHFLSNCRHLGDELSHSSVGRLIGASDIVDEDGLLDN